MPSVLYHCPCLSSAVAPPAPNLPSSSHVFHPLSSLYFCEECDAVRCNRCVFIEVSGYYCPNCLFEVPSASVRAEKNRCVGIIIHLFYSDACVLSDVRGIVFFVRIVEIPCLLCPLTHLSPRTLAFKSKLVPSENLHSSYTAIPAGGTLQTSGSSSTSQQV